MIYALVYLQTDTEFLKLCNITIQSLCKYCSTNTITFQYYCPLFSVKTKILQMKEWLGKGWFDISGNDTIWCYRWHHFLKLPAMKTMAVTFTVCYISAMKKAIMPKINATARVTEDSACWWGIGTVIYLPIMHDCKNAHLLAKAKVGWWCALWQSRDEMELLYTLWLEWLSGFKLYPKHNVSENRAMDFDR